MSDHHDERPYFQPSEGITKKLDELMKLVPSKMSKEKSKRACRLMSSLVVATAGVTDDEEEEEQYIHSMVALMHASMHESPKLVTLLAVNCLTQLEIMTRIMGVGQDERMDIFSGLYQVANQIAKDQMLLTDGNSSATSGATH